MNHILPVGKLPHDLLDRIIHSLPASGPSVRLGPGIGLDCAVLEFGEQCLVLKTEPITFASDDIGWYAVQIAANDIATTGAAPKWAMFTVLLPENRTSEKNVVDLTRQLADACRGTGIAVVGGHTEITHDLNRVIIVTTLIGEVARANLITPAGAQPDDVILLTKGVPIEATALLAREFSTSLETAFTREEIQTAADYLTTPGISILRDAQIAVTAGGVTAMHDPTEGGVATALWELAQACQKSLFVQPESILVPELSSRICQYFHLDPLGTIASGALLLTVKPAFKEGVIDALTSAGISVAEIGTVSDGPCEVLYRDGLVIKALPRFDRDEISRVFEQYEPDQPV